MTLREVARLAGVSPSSVSRYLNGGPLSDQKRALIRDAIQKTGYYPDQAAHTLRTGKVRQIGVIVPRIHSEAVSQVTAGIAEVLSGAGYLPVLGSSGSDPRREERYLEMLRAFHVAGIILMATNVNEHMLNLYRSCSVPLIIAGQHLPACNCVFYDDYHAMRDLASLMLQRGRRTLCYIGVDERDVAVGQERLRGARDALYAAGCNAEEMPVAVAGFHWKSGYDRMRQILTNFPHIDGVLCATDTIAQGALLALREAGRHVPEDVSIAGVGDDWADMISVPQLTTARLSQSLCGREAASILLRLIDGTESEPVNRMLGYDITDRGSV